VTRLLEISEFKMLPQTTFTEFAMEQYSEHLKEAIREGQLAEADLPQYANQAAADEFVKAERENLENRFRVVRDASRGGAGARGTA